VFPEKAEIFSFIAAATITAGQPVYFTSAGKVDVADANGSGTDTFAGIALEGGGAGQVISVLKRGHVYGFTLAGAYGSLAYVSNTVGELADAAGSTSLVAGHVVPLTDKALTKVLYINALSW
jgi:hypothetical protein